MGNDFNEQTIDVLMMENVSDSTKKLSSKLLKLIEYYNDSASIKIKNIRRKKQRYESISGKGRSSHF